MPEGERVLRLRFATLRTNGDRGVRVRESILDVSTVQMFHKVAHLVECACPTVE